MVTTVEKLRRTDPAVCRGCGWNVVVMDGHSECANAQCLRLGVPVPCKRPKARQVN
jgi:hypothetical protein